MRPRSIRRRAQRRWAQRQTGATTNGRNGDERNGDERNGDGRNGDERNGDERNGDERTDNERTDNERNDNERTDNERTVVAGKPVGLRSTVVMAPRWRDPLLDALIVAAVDATQAGRGWLLAVASEQLVVVAAHGEDAPACVGRTSAVVAGWAGFAVESKRPVALIPDADDDRFASDVVLGAGARPTSLLCFPCPYGGRVVGAVQLVDKANGSPFDVDDVELMGMLAEVAGVAIHQSADRAVAAPLSPDELGIRLRLLAAHDRARYNAVADVVSELLTGC